MPFYAIRSLSQRIRNSNQIKFITKKTNEWKEERYATYCESDIFDKTIELFVKKFGESMSKFYDNLIDHVKDRIKSTKELLELLNEKGKDIMNFGKKFLEIKFEYENKSENLFKLFLVAVKEFEISPKEIEFESDDEKKLVVLGKGSFGTVFKANYGDIPVAVKQLKFSGLKDPEFSQNILIRDLVSEEEALSSLSCPYIVKYYGCYLNVVENKIESLNLVTALAEKSKKKKLFYFFFFFLIFYFFFNIQ